MNVSAAFEYLFVNKRALLECLDDTRNATPPEEPKIFHSVMTVMVAWEACGFMWLSWHIRGIGSVYLRYFITSVYLSAVVPLCLSMMKIVTFDNCQATSVNIYHHMQWIIFLFHMVANQKFIYKFSPWFIGRWAKFFRRTYYEKLLFYVILVYTAIRSFICLLERIPGFTENMQNTQSKGIMTALLFAIAALWIAFGQMYLHTHRPFDPPPDYLTERNISMAFSFICMFDPEIGRLFFDPSHNMWGEVMLALKTLCYFALIIWAPSEADTCGLKVRQDLREMNNRMRQLDNIFEPEAPQIAEPRRSVDLKKIPGVKWILKTVNLGHRYKNTAPMRLSTLEERTQYGAANPI